MSALSASLRSCGSASGSAGSAWMTLKADAMMMSLPWLPLCIHLVESNGHITLGFRIFTCKAGMLPLYETTSL